MGTDKPGYLLLMSSELQQSAAFLSTVLFQNVGNSRALVAHACDSSYSGERDQEDQGSRLVLGNGSRDPIPKIPNTRKG
jgi:hypothetical protein